MIRRGRKKKFFLLLLKINDVIKRRRNAKTKFKKFRSRFCQSKTLSLYRPHLLRLIFRITHSVLPTCIEIQVMNNVINRIWGKINILNE